MLDVIRSSFDLFFAFSPPTCHHSPFFAFSPSTCHIVPRNSAVRSRHSIPSSCWVFREKVRGLEEDEHENFRCPSPLSGASQRRRHENFRGPSPLLGAVAKIVATPCRVQRPASLSYFVCSTRLMQTLHKSSASAPMFWDK